MKSLFKGQCTKKKIYGLFHLITRINSPACCEYCISIQSKSLKIYFNERQALAASLREFLVQKGLKSKAYEGSVYILPLLTSKLVYVLFSKVWDKIDSTNSSIIDTIRYSLVLFIVTSVFYVFILNDWH